MHLNRPPQYYCVTVKLPAFVFFGYGGKLPAPDFRFLIEGEKILLRKIEANSPNCIRDLPSAASLAKRLSPLMDERFEEIQGLVTNF